MPDPLLGLHTYVAALDDMSGLLTLQATTLGPAGSLVVELDDVTFALDGADPRLLNFVEVDGAALTRDARTMELFQTLVGDHVAVAAVQLARSGATKPTRLQPEPNRRELPVPPRAIRFALAHSGMTAPGLTEVERAAATIEAIASARRLGLLDHLPDGLDLLADAAAVLAETLARTPGDAPASLPPELATLTADRSMSSAVADSCDDAASVARPADAAILSQVAQRLRARPNADDRDGRPAGPGRTTTTSGHDPAPVQVLPDSLPLLVSATVPAVARTGADEYEVRLPGWAGRVDGWWVRAFRVGSSTPLAVVPMRDEGTDAVALMLLARHDAEQFELDIVDEPSQPRSSERVAAFLAAIATGQRAARLERLDRPTDATYAWERSSELHLRAGDDDRARQASARAAGGQARSTAPSGPGIAATVVDRLLSPR